jgi:DNA-binding XRE family transcriptional regulator
MTSEELKQWRSDMQMTQRAAAEALGITQSTYSALERGTSYARGELIKIDRRTELACKYLLFLKSHRHDLPKSNGEQK